MRAIRDLRKYHVSCLTITFGYARKGASTLQANGQNVMNIDQFWSMVEKVHVASGGDMKVKCRLLGEALRQLSPEEVRSFGKHFTDCYYEAYSWDIWGAAYIICRGCSDDGFMDFRSTLISLGRAPFQAALSNADSLADFNIDPVWARFEGYQYVVSKVYEEMNVSDKKPSDEDSQRGKKHPCQVKGNSFDERQMTPRFPRLVAKYGYKDLDPILVKQQDERAVRDFKMIHRVAAIMLEAGIVSSCGLIPPPRIVSKILRTGQAPASTGRHYTWEPIELDEKHYWVASGRLQGMRPEELAARPDLKGVKISSDVGASGIDDFDDWMNSLKERGLVQGF